MKNLTTPKAILFGLGLIALVIASVPYSSTIVKPAFASNGIHKISICNENGSRCVAVESNESEKNKDYMEIDRLSRLWVTR